MKVETLGCPYCGEIQTVEVSDTATEEGMRAAIVRNCTCPGARREISMQDVGERLDVLWGDGCERLFERQASPDERDKMATVAGWIWDGFLESARLVTSDGDVCLMREKDGRILVARTQKRERKL